MIKDNKAIFSVLSFAIMLTSCRSYSYYKPISSSQAFIPSTKSFASKPAIFRLGDCELRTTAGLGENKNTIFLDLSFRDDKGRCKGKISGLRIDFNELTANKRSHELQMIKLYKQARHTTNTDIETMTGTSISFALDTVNFYSLEYFYGNLPKEKALKRFQVRIEMQYEVDKETRFLKDSITFERRKERFLSLH